MKLSTARRLVCMSYFTVDGLRPLLATATRIVCSGDTKRFLFPDGSVIESTNGHWKVVGMEKNPKLEAAVKRFGGFAEGGYISGNGGYTGEPKGEIAGVVRGTGQVLYKGDVSPSKVMFTDEQICKHFMGPHGTAEFGELKFAESETMKIVRLESELSALQELCNEKDEQLDAMMVVRLDWWLIALLGVVLVAHYGFKVL